MIIPYTSLIEKNNNFVPKFGLPKSTKGQLIHLGSEIYIHTLILLIQWFQKFQNVRNKRLRSLKFLLVIMMDYSW